MSRTRTINALVLRTYDVGEADRFCVLLTPEEGRMTARASGVRRLTSRMGASLIPFAEVKLMLRESSKGDFIAGAERGQDAEPLSLNAFAQASQGVELLLRLLQDSEAVPGVFTLTLQFFSACRLDLQDAFPRFALRLLHQLGFLPDPEHLRAHMKILTPEDERFLAIVRSKDDERLWTDEAPVSLSLKRLLTVLLHDHLSAPLKAGAVKRMLG